MDLKPLTKFVVSTKPIKIEYGLAKFENNWYRVILNYNDEKLWKRLYKIKNDYSNDIEKLKKGIFKLANNDEEMNDFFKKNGFARMDEKEQEDILILFGNKSKKHWTDEVKQQSLFDENESHYLEN